MAAQGREGVSRGASASATLSGIRSRSFAARASAPASRRSFPLALAALAMAVAVALTILAVDLALRANGVERSDARLVEALRASAGALSLKVRTAEAEAETLAESQAVQLALANHDQSRLNDLVGQARVPVLVQGTEGAEAGRTVADAIRRSATIGPPGSRLGQVTAFVPLDGRLLDSIERTSDAHAGIAIALARGGTLVVAPGLLQDARLAVR
ncbi:MAG TPA: hypothetical protein VF063_01400, partial [Gaiellaceae bacterium]